MKYAHLAWPFFEPTHREFASELDRWVSVHLGEFEQDEGNDGRAARKIFELLALSGWLKQTLPARAAPHDPAKIDLRSVCLLREISAYSSAIADVALSASGTVCVYSEQSTDLLVDALGSWTASGTESWLATLLLLQRSSSVNVPNSSPSRCSAPSTTRCAEPAEP